MEKRSDSDVLLKELSLTFGEKEYKVPVLRMRASAEWRKQFFEQTQQVASSMNVKLEENSPNLSEALGHSLTQALLAFPEAIPNLVLSYASSLPKEEVLEAAYDQQFLIAFKAIWGVAFQPFLSSLGMVMEMQKSQPSPSPSSGALN